MHKALNETLAALPDDTKVYVSRAETLEEKSQEHWGMRGLTTPVWAAGTRVHEAKRQVPGHGAAERRGQESAKVCREQ